MSAAEQENPRKPNPAESPDTALQPAGEGPDLSFARLLEQLEAEADNPAFRGGVSQIFAAPFKEAPPAAAQPLATQAFASSAFAPAQPSLDRSFAPQPAQPVTPWPGTSATATGIGAFAPHPAPPDVPHARTPEPSPTAQPMASSAAEAPAATEPTPASSPAPPAGGFAQSHPAAPRQPETAGEFTRIFTQLPTPRSAPPSILAEVAAASPVPPPAPEPQPGEFTQFFRSIDPSKPAEPSKPFAPPQAADPAFLPFSQVPPAAAPAAQPEAQQAAHPSPETTRSIDPAAAHAFQPAPPASPALAFAPTAPGPPQAVQPRAGEFTALFNSPAPGAREIAASPSPAAPVRSPAQEPSFPAGFAEPPRSQPAAAGGFTELLRTLSTEGTPALATPTARPPQPAFGQAPANPAPELLPGQFPEQFAPPASPPPQDSPPRNIAFAPQPSPQQPPAGDQRPGEFTQLMQSLQSSNPKPPTTPGQTPFFDNAGPAYAQGESEFTRIIRTSAARSSQAPVPAFAPAPQSGGSASIGLPIAAPQRPRPTPPALPAAPVKTRLQAMMPVLLAANGVLLLLLILLAVLFFHHHH